jgi:hypothetical protein
LSKDGNIRDVTVFVIGALVEVKTIAELGVFRPVLELLGVDKQIGAVVHGVRFDNWKMKERTRIDSATKRKTKLERKNKQHTALFLNLVSDGTNQTVRADVHERDVFGPQVSSQRLDRVFVQSGGNDQSELVKEGEFGADDGGRIL